MFLKVDDCKKGKISKERLLASFQGWQAYAKWADSFKLRRDVVKKISDSSQLQLILKKWVAQDMQGS